MAGQSEAKNTKLDEQSKKRATKRAHLMMFFGALIVFLTFVAKEGLSEYWRKIAEAIDTAQYMYSIRMDISSEKMQLNEVKRTLTAVNRTIERRDKPSGATVGGLSPLRGEGNRSSLINIETTLSNIKILTDKLPGEEKLEKTMSAFGNHVLAAKNEMKAVESDKQAKSSATAAAPRKGTTYEMKGGRFGKQLNPETTWSYSSPRDTFFMSNYWTLNYPGEDREIDLEQSLNDLQLDVDAFNGEVLQIAESARKRNDKCATYSWRLSALFFTVGWGLGLAGKLRGIPGLEGTGE